MKINNKFIAVRRNFICSVCNKLDSEEEFIVLSFGGLNVYYCQGCADEFINNEK